MEQAVFLACIRNPEEAGVVELKQFEELQKEFPFCQSAHLLYALGLYASDHPQYQVQLKRASAYASDRRQLKRLIDRYRAAHPKPVIPSREALPKKPAPAVQSHTPGTTAPLHPSAPSLRHPVTPSPHHPVTPSLHHPVTPSLHHPVTPSPHHPITPSSQHLVPTAPPRIAFRPVVPGMEEQPGGDLLREKLLEIVHKRLKEIAEEHGENPEAYTRKEPAATAPDPGVRSRVSFAVESPGPLSKQELIEKFIKEEPRISSPRKVVLKPTHLVPRDSQEEDEIVSETLAILYHKQGNTGKSIRVYEKLCLLFPEKSSYFAARIEDLRSKKPPDDEGIEA